MANQQNQKLKMLKIMEYLRTDTDEEHPISMPEILRRLEADGIPAERKSVYTDLAILEDFGLDIIQSKNRTNGGYYLGSRDFELPEVKLLVDAVSASKFITEKKSTELVKKIEGLVSKEQAKQLHRQVVVMDRLKGGSEEIYYAVDVIYNCIDNDCRMQFQYVEWTPEGELQYRHDGALYEVSPAFLLWDNENYYLVAYDEKSKGIRHYRVDKIRNASAMEEARGGRQEREALRLSDYSKRTFGMFAGKEETIRLRTSPEMAGVFRDRFGSDVAMRQEGTDLFVRVSVQLSSQFYGWLAGLGSKVEVMGPEPVRSAYRDYLEEILAQYKES